MRYISMFLLVLTVFGCTANGAKVGSEFQSVKDDLVKSAGLSEGDANKVVDVMNRQATGDEIVNADYEHIISVAEKNADLRSKQNVLRAGVAISALANMNLS